MKDQVTKMLQGLVDIPAGLIETIVGMCKDPKKLITYIVVGVVIFDIYSDGELLAQVLGSAGEVLTMVKKNALALIGLAVAYFAIKK